MNSKLRTLAVALAMSACGGGSTVAVAIGISPAAVSVPVNGTAQFFTAVTGSTNTAVTWALQEIDGGSVNGAGLYTAPPVAGTFHLVATSQADPAKTSTATITVTPPDPTVAVNVVPAGANLHTGGTLRFAAAVSNARTTAVSWSVQESGGGSVDSSGLYAAPDTAGTYHVIATSVADPGKRGVAIVVVSRPPVLSPITIAPATANVHFNGLQQFMASMAGATTPANWSVQEAGGGSITRDGLYTAPGTAGVFHVVAKALDDDSNRATAAVSVTSPVSVTINPITASVQVNQTQQFTAAVFSSPNVAVRWSLLESDSGMVSNSGLYTAPATPGTFHVVATSVADPSVSATAAVLVQTPDAPLVAAVALCRAVELSWSASASAYGVSRSPHGAGTFTLISSPTHQPVPGARWSFIDSDPALPYFTTYDYRVFALNPDGPGSPGQVTVTTPMEAPGGLRAYPGDTQVSLVWTAPPSIPAGTQWQVERRGRTGAEVLGGTANTSMTDRSAQSSTSYSYFVMGQLADVSGCSSLVEVMTGDGTSAITQSTQALFTNLSGDGKGGVARSSVVRDLSHTPIVAISFDATGAPTGHPGAGTADGNFTIPGVPPGPAFIQLANFRGYTGLRRLDASSAINGRANLAYTSMESDVSVPASGLVPFNAGDTLEATVIGTGTNVDLIAAAKSGAPPAAATSVNLVNDWNASVGARVDLSQGDFIWLTNVAQVSGAATPYRALQRACAATLTPAALGDGQAATLGCADGGPLRQLSPISASLDWRASQFAAAAMAGAGPSGTLASSALVIYGLEDAPEYGTQFLMPTLLELDQGKTALDVAQSVSYGSPDWAAFTPITYAASSAGVPVTAAPSAACPAPASTTVPVSNFSYDGVSLLGSGVAPLVQPVTNVQLTAGPAIADPVIGNGTPVTVSWTAPASGNAPVAYRVFLYSLTADASCNTVASVERTVWSFGPAQSLVIPPRMFVSNDGSRRYAAVVRSYWWDGTTDPSRVLLLFTGTRRGTAESFGGTFLH